MPPEPSLQAVGHRYGYRNIEQMPAYDPLQAQMAQKYPGTEIYTGDADKPEILNIGGGRILVSNPLRLLLIPDELHAFTDFTLDQIGKDNLGTYVALGAGGVAAVLGHSLHQESNKNDPRLDKVADQIRQLVGMVDRKGSVPGIDRRGFLSVGVGLTVGAMTGATAKLGQKYLSAEDKNQKMLYSNALVSALRKLEKWEQDRWQNRDSTSLENGWSR